MCEIFTAIVHQDTDKAFGLTFPDLPGCFAAADSRDGIQPAANEALDLWFDDQPGFEPSSLDALRQLPTVQQALSEGASLMTIPYTPTDNTIWDKRMAELAAENAKALD